MKNDSLLGPWIRRFLLEHLVAERICRGIRSAVIETRCACFFPGSRFSRRHRSMFWRSRTYRPTPCGTSSRASKKSVAAASQLATRGCQPYTPLHTSSANAALST